MPADRPDKTYYCTQCRIETSLARVCPKCHRKTTLRLRDQSPDTTGGARRRASVTGATTANPWPHWVWLLGGAVATAALVAGIWWGFAHWRHRPTGKTTGAAKTGTLSPAATGDTDRIFGAPSPGTRVAPQGPPRICGAAYRVSVHYRFATEPPKAKALPKAKKPVPQALEHLHSFLVNKRRDKWTWVPMAYEVKITVDGHTVTGLKLDHTGGYLPDRRSRRPRRLGYHDSLQPGLRISDLIGRIGADLLPDPRGGLKVTRQRLKNPLVSQWLQTSIHLTRFLHPHPPGKGARVFEDRRLPPTTLIPGLKNLVRRFRLQPGKKPGTAQTATTYRIDAPARVMRRAHSSTPVQGQVVVAPGEPLPKKAMLRLDKVPRKGGGTQTVTLRLDHLGRRCNK